MINLKVQGLLLALESDELTDTSETTCITMFNRSPEVLNLLFTSTKFQEKSVPSAYSKILVVESTSSSSLLTHGSKHQAQRKEINIVMVHSSTDNSYDYMARTTKLFLF